MTQSPHVLDNPVWHALNTNHAHFSLGVGLAKRYPPDIAPFVALADASDAAFADLAQIMEQGERLVLRGFTVPEHLIASKGWTVHQSTQIVQMICDQPTAEIESNTPIISLSSADVPDILHLIERTEPGPFLQRTIELGHYLGIRVDGQLIAMAGERMYPPGYREISAVCTLPEYRGKGYARLLVNRLQAEIWREGDVPILHVMPHNTRAQQVYLSLGFRKRRDLSYTILSR